MFPDLSKLPEMVEKAEQAAERAEARHQEILNCHAANADLMRKVIEELRNIRTELLRLNTSV